MSSEIALKNTADCGCDEIRQPMLSVEEGLAQILAGVNPLRETETVSLRAGLGRVLAREVNACVDVPAFCGSAMDGYAFWHDDAAYGGRFRVAGVALAGQPFEGELAPGECVRIMTGAMLPPQTDTVIMQEQVARDENMIEMRSLPARGANVRHPGENLRIGETIFTPGRRLNAVDLGLLASQGIDQVDVVRRPRVGVFSTGDELRAEGEPLRPGELYDSNRHSLFGLLDKLDVEILDLGIIPDRQRDIDAVLKEASLSVDLLMSSGGVSVGDADFVVKSLQSQGEVSLWKVAMKPGKPIAFGKLHNRCLFFGLPGNPVSVVATFLLFARPAILRLRGEHDIALPQWRAVCDTPISKKPGRRDYQRGSYRLEPDGQVRVSVKGEQGSHILRSMSETNCFVVLSEAAGDIVPGTELTIIPTTDLL